MKRPGTDALSPTRLQAGGDPALSVIVPTRNEASNIEPLLARLQDALAGIDAEVLVVDDSDDATPQIARQIAARSALPIRVHARPPGQRSGGLGGAVLVGFSEALAPVCVVMDADLQHPPELLGTLLGVSRTGADFVIASRYVDGGGDEGLGGWYRHAVSMLATWVAKRVLRPELAGISDPMSGFFLVRRSCLDLPSLHPQGFKLLLELLARHPRATVAEVPYTFEARHSGASKAGLKEGFTYLRRLAGLRAQARRAPQRPRRQLVPAACGASADRPSAGHQLPPPGCTGRERHLFAALTEVRARQRALSLSWKQGAAGRGRGSSPGFRPMEPRWNGLLPCWLAVEQDWDLAQSSTVVILGVGSCDARNVARKHLTKSGTASHAE